MKKINQPQGPRTGNMGDMAKVKRFHQRHDYANMLSDSVNRAFGTGRPQGSVTPAKDKTNGIMPHSINTRRKMPR